MPRLHTSHPGPEVGGAHVLSPLRSGDDRVALGSMFVIGPIFEDAGRLQRSPTPPPSQ